jgi:solute carrier family 50 (sugar transporter)
MYGTCGSWFVYIPMTFIIPSSTTISSAFLGVCGHVAPVAAIGVFLAPFPTLLQIRRERSVGDYPLLPYSSMISSAFVWVVYGILQSQPKVWFPNSVGLILGWLYFWNFVQYSPTKAPTLPGSVQQHILGTISLMLICLGAMSANGASTVGMMGVVLCVFMFGSPLSALRVVLKTKSAKAIPLPFTMASVVNCFLWSVTGLLDMKDYAIYVPNLLGLSFGLAQLALKILYGDGPKEELASLM